MSAFIIPEKTINNLVNCLSTTAEKYYNPETKERVELTPTEVGQILTNENYKSINFRYNENEKPPTYKFKLAFPFASPIQVIKSAHCYGYQTCEHEGYETSFAKYLIGAVIENAIYKLEGYEEAEWG